MQTINKRIFIAIDIAGSASLKAMIRNFRRTLAGDSIKWVEDDNFHLTLYFLGETNIKTIDNLITDISREIENISKFSISLQGVGIFGNINNPKVLWIGIKDKSGNLKTIQGKLSKMLVNYDFPEDQQKFSPHLTLGRIRAIKDISPLKNLIEQYREVPFQELKVSKIVLHESKLTHSGPIYSTIKEFPLSQE